MKYCNVVKDGKIILAGEKDGRVFDLSPLTMNDLFKGAVPEAFGEEIENPQFANVVDPGNIICVGLNYKAHADNVDFKAAACPTLFSKFGNALTSSGAPVELPTWESSYDYEAELVIVIGKQAWNVSEEEADGYIFGYSCGNDMSLRDAQKLTTQWLIGKTMPGFAPCGPFVVTADEFNPYADKNIKSYVNGELRQNGFTSDMIFNCRQIVSFASKYIRLEPGDLIFTGTPSGVILEKAEKKWLKPGDLVEVEIEGIGKLSNKMI